MDTPLPVPASPTDTENVLALPSAVWESGCPFGMLWSVVASAAAAPLAPLAPRAPLAPPPLPLFAPRLPLAGGASCPFFGASAAVLSLIPGPNAAVDTAAPAPLTDSSLFTLSKNPLAASAPCSCTAAKDFKAPEMASRRFMAVAAASSPLLSCDLEEEEDEEAEEEEEEIADEEGAEDEAEDEEDEEVEENPNPEVTSWTPGLKMPATTCTADIDRVRATSERRMACAQACSKATRNPSRCLRFNWFKTY